MKRHIKALLLSPVAKKIVDIIEVAFPPIRTWHRFEYEQHFLRTAQWERLFSGVYSSFAAATAAIPKTRHNSYDNPASATFLGHKAAIRSTDYPVLFWLSQLLPQNSRVFDFGGYLGISYYSFERFLHYPSDLQWTIYDVPAVVSAGTTLAERKNCPQLTFTTDFSRAQNFSLLLAFGSLQFPEQTLAECLRALPTRPQHLLLNKVPLADRETFYTLHNMGPALSPYRIANREEFLQSFDTLGYKLIDEWENPELGCVIPFHPTHSVRAFSGMYLQLQ
jgi:putative methyltransferase (TIGR04325 family)